MGKREGKMQRKYEKMNIYEDKSGSPKKIWKREYGLWGTSRMPRENTEM
jgi:hypothetical protein